MFVNDSKYLLFVFTILSDGFFKDFCALLKIRELYTKLNTRLAAVARLTKHCKKSWEKVKKKCCLFCPENLFYPA